MSGSMTLRPSTVRTLPNLAFAAHAVDAGAADGAPKTRVQLFPMGTVRGRDGRGPYRLDDLAHAQAVVAASLDTAGATQIPVDYDHQIPFAVKDGVGGTAPASGWITALEATAEGIFATIDWTEAATAKIKAREYRYISPYFGFEPATGRLTRIWNAGLVNLPNFTELAAVASADPQGNEMDLKALAKALGLAEDATLEQITAAAATLKATADSAAEKIAAAAAGAVDPKAYVPMEVFTELQGRVRALQEASAEEKATAAVDAAVKAGKITPATRGYALTLHKADPEAFAAFVGSAPVVLDPEKVETGGAKLNLDGPLSPEEKATAAAMGVTEEAFLASKKQLAGKL
jgi:phage I-like protein